MRNSTDCWIDTSIETTSDLRDFVTTQLESSVQYTEVPTVLLFKAMMYAVFGYPYVAEKEADRDYTDNYRRLIWYIFQENTIRSSDDTHIQAICDDPQHYRSIYFHQFVHYSITCEKDNLFFLYKNLLAIVLHGTTISYPKHPKLQHATLQLFYRSDMKCVCDHESNFDYPDGICWFHRWAEWCYHEYQLQSELENNVRFLAYFLLRLYLCRATDTVTTMYPVIRKLRDTYKQTKSFK